MKNGQNNFSKILVAEDTGWEKKKVWAKIAEEMNWVCVKVGELAQKNTGTFIAK